MSEERDDTAVAEWPIELGELGKGDMIGPEILEPYFGVKMDDPVYRVKLMNFANALERALAVIGLGVVVRSDHGSAKLLTDQEAALYTQARFDAHWRGLYRTNRRAHKVDLGLLDRADRARHDRALVVQGAMLAASDGVMARLSATPYQRNTPLAFRGEADA